MKKIFALFVLGVLLLGYIKTEAVDRKAIIDSLTTIDPEIRKYFPRWKVCETDLQIQVYRVFKILGFDEKLLSQSSVEILAAPKTDPLIPFDILLITCGKASLNSNQISKANIGPLVDILSGDWSFISNYYNDPPKRDYCYKDISPEIDVTMSQAEAIISYLEPTNVTHAITLSLFEQTLKLGDTDFWLRNVVGTDPVGYHFWSAGESKLLLKRPLYPNYDIETSSQIPNLIYAYLGGVYRLTSGNGNQGTLMSWVPDRKLNSTPGGKIVAGLDFSMPFHPQFGLDRKSVV